MKCIHDMSSTGKDIRHTLLMWFFFIQKFWHFENLSYFILQTIAKLIILAKYRMVFIWPYILEWLRSHFFCYVFSHASEGLSCEISRWCTYGSDSPIDVSMCHLTRMTKNMRKMIWIHITHMGKGNQVGLKLAEYTYV